MLILSNRSRWWFLRFSWLYNEYWFVLSMWARLTSEWGRDISILYLILLWQFRGHELLWFIDVELFGHFNNFWFLLIWSLLLLSRFSLLLQLISINLWAFLELLSQLLAIILLIVSSLFFHFLVLLIPSPLVYLRFCQAGSLWHS